jgi:cytoskeletal protein RodZ
MRGVSLDEVCAATRISTRFLSALENEDWEKLPGGVFNRGFIRAVARYLGLNEDAIVAEYVAATQELLPPSALVVPAQKNTGRAHKPLAAAAGFVLVLACAVWLGWRFLPMFSERRLPPDAAATAPTESDPPAALAQAPASAASSPSITSKLELKIEAGRETTVTVTADGSNRFQGAMIAGQTRLFEVQGQLTIWAEDAGALLLQLNGRILPPIGPPGAPAVATLTRRDLSAVPGGAD